MPFIKKQKKIAKDLLIDISHSLQPLNQNGKRKYSKRESNRHNKKKDERMQKKTMPNNTETCQIIRNGKWERK